MSLYSSKKFVVLPICTLINFVFNLNKRLLKYEKYNTILINKKVPKYNISNQLVNHIINELSCQKSSDATQSI